jgi:predicted nucleic acid-binding Zn ribbon protein
VNEAAPEPARDALGDLARRMAGRGAKRRALASDRVAEAWREAAGPALASTTRVRGFKDGVATVQTASAPLCHELASFRREELLAALNARLAEKKGPAVRSLVFRIGAD